VFAVDGVEVESDTSPAGAAADKHLSGNTEGERQYDVTFGLISPATLTFRTRVCHGPAMLPTATMVTVSAAHLNLPGLLWGLCQRKASACRAGPKRKLGLP
jgi:hypothetical protein